MSKQLLVIEDNKSIASVIKHLGDSLGYQVTIAESFAKVKSLLAHEQKFFVATVDFNLPDAPNGEVIPYVIERGMPSIIMTGRMDEKTHRKVLNLPVIDYIMKENAQAYHYLLRILSGQLTNSNIGILLVDNSTAARNKLALLLKRRNFTVYCTANAAEALTVLDQRSDIKMVIVEQEMPITNGVQLVQQIRRKYAANELIIMGLTDAEHHFQAERFIKNGADDYLKKPFSSEEFYCRILQNIERLSHVEEMEKLANSDDFTALLNRRCFLEQTKIMLNTEYEQPSVLLLAILHIDKFQELNDKYGYKLGRKLLIEIANILKTQFSTDITARLNGAEFAVFIKNKELQVIKLALKLLLQHISKHSIEFSGKQINISISLGGKLVKETKTLQSLLKGADQALIQAKQQGGNQLIINED